MATKESPACDPINITVTEHEDLRRIMIHEFPQKTAIKNYPTLNEAAVVAEGITPLTCEQKKFLRTRPRKGASDRLVMFITMLPSDSKSPSLQPKLMGAVDSQSNEAVYSNATFHVFHCSEKQDPTLLCFSKYFVRSMNRGSSIETSRNEMPTSAQIYKIGAAAYLPSRDHPVSGSTVYHRIYTSDGKDVMPNNFVHGFINTHGCWMMFRNHNWPKKLEKNNTNFPNATQEELYEKFFEAFQFKRRGDLGPMADRLKELGYVTQFKPKPKPNQPLPPPPQKEVSDFNVDKLMKWDHNYAYCWFLRDLLGIEYFSTYDKHTDFNVDGEEFYPLGIDVNSDDPTEQQKAVAHRMNKAGKNDHDVSEMKPSEAAKVYTKDLFRNEKENVLGFMPQESWSVEANLEKATWADLVIYK